MVSWGVGCGRAKRPGVYTKLQDYNDWINTSMMSMYSSHMQHVQLGLLVGRVLHIRGFSLILWVQHSLISLYFFIIDNTLMGRGSEQPEGMLYLK